MRGEAFARQLKLLALLEVRPEGVELEEAAGDRGAVPDDGDRTSPST
jgi:hypothetical protein